MDVYCGPKQLARMVGSEWFCYDGFFFGYGDRLTKCVTNCGEAVKCYGVAFSERGRPLENASSRLGYLIQSHCRKLACGYK